MDTTRLGILFDGGGFAGAYSVGYMKAVEEFGISSPVYCQGVSVGAINAAKIVECQGKTQSLEKIWKRVEDQGPRVIFPTHETFLRPFKNSLFSGRGLKSLIDWLDCQAVRDSDVILEVMTRNENTHKQEVFSNRDDIFQKDPVLLKKIIFAAMALRGFFPPVTINGCVYSDGISFLIERAIRFGCTTIFLFLNDDGSFPIEGSTVWWLKRLLTGIHDMSTMLTDKEIGDAMSVNHNLKVFEGTDKQSSGYADAIRRFNLKRLLKNLRFTFKEKRPVSLVVFRPQQAIETLWTIGFEKGDIRRAIDHGYEVGMEVLKKETRA